MQAAIKVINQLAWLAKDGGRVEVTVQRPEPDQLELARAIAARVPAAWHEAGGGWLRCELVLPGDRIVSWSVTDVQRPDGWEPTVDLSAAWLRAGEALAAIALEAMKATAADLEARREAARKAS